MLPQASTLASNVDVLYDFIFWTSVVSFVLIIGAMLYFVLRFNRRRKDEDRTAYITGHTPLEISVAVVLFVWVMVIFAWGWVDYKKMVTLPSESLEINLIGRQWTWSVEYANGRKLRDELVVPQGVNVKLTMTSADVLHSFYVPEFRLKQDVVPGMFTKLWFNATEEGEYTSFCAEYCGFDHSQMMAKVRVLRPKAYEKWYRKWKGNTESGGAPADSVAARGAKVFEAKGCNACHTVDGSKSVAPTFLGAYGTKRKLMDGSSVLMDENYIRESLMEPSAKISAGFPPVMPTFKGLVTDEEIVGLVAYIKSVKEKKEEVSVATDSDEQSLEDQGEKIFESLACNACHSIDGSSGIGPSLREIYSAEKNEVYLKEAIINPQGSMPSYKYELNQKELKALLEYLKGI